MLRKLLLQMLKEERSVYAVLLVDLYGLDKVGVVRNSPFYTLLFCTHTKVTLGSEHLIKFKFESQI